MMTNQPTSQYLSQQEIFDKLTSRQKQIFDLVGMGKTNAIISSKLFLSESTVKNERYQMCQSLNLKGHYALYELSIKIKYNHKK